jgi:unsaturated rhamnogalacturonyl hydrolase
MCPAKPCLMAVLLAAALAPAAVRAAEPPPGRTPGEVLALMERVADWQLAHPSSVDPTDWQQAAGYAGMMALVGVSESPRFRDAMVRMGEANRWQLGPRPYHADDHAVGQTYVELFQRRHEPAMIAPLQERFDWVLANPKDDNLDFDQAKNPDRTDRWSWCDALFMAPPAWMKLWQVTGNPAYLDYAARKWWVTSDYLYDRKERLYFRDSTQFTKREANGRKIFWSRGNGWVIAGLARVLDVLPASHPSRERFLAQYREMAERVAGLQQDDGLWRASLLDPKGYPLKESSGSAFYCYALSWGVNRGLLDRGRYEPKVRKTWQALTECVDPDGKLTHVQPVGYDPRKFEPSSTAPYGVGAFLLAGSEVHRMVAGAAKGR